MTVGFGVTPNLLTPALGDCDENRALAGLCEKIAITAGGDFHPALRTLMQARSLQRGNDTP